MGILEKGALFDKIYTSKVYTSKVYPYENYYLEFELSLQQNEALKRVKYVQGTKIYQKKGDGLIYERLTGNELYNMEVHREWKTIEKRVGKKSNPDYEIKTCQQSKNGKTVQYYMVLIIEKYWEKTVTTEMIYKRCFDTNR